MNYLDLLEENGFKDKFNTCINVHTRNFDFNLAFIERETDENLCILVTDESGREKLKIINKEFVEYVEIVYQDDIYSENDGEENTDRMFH